MLVTKYFQSQDPLYFNFGVFSYSLTGRAFKMQVRILLGEFRAGFGSIPLDKNKHSDVYKAVSTATAVMQLDGKPM